jgi:hypothetical protein
MVPYIATPKLFPEACIFALKPNIIYGSSIILATACKGQPADLVAVLH